MSTLQPLLLPNSILTTTSLVPTIITGNVPPPSPFGSSLLDSSHPPVLGTSPDVPVAFGLHRAVATDLRAGVVNRLLGVDARLAFSHEESAGDADNHTFFTVGDIRWAPTWSSFDMTYIVRGRDGNGYPETRRFVLPAEESAPPDYRIQRINEEALKIIRDNKARLFRSHTRKVFFKGSDGRMYAAYYKFTPSAGVEAVAGNLLASIGVMYPAMQASAAPNAFWTRDMGGRSFGDIVHDGSRTDPNFSEWAGAWFLLHLSQQRDRNPGTLLDSIGLASMAMFLLGNTDMHQQNILLGDGDSCIVLDLETAGMPDIHESSTIRDFSSFVRYYYNRSFLRITCDSRDLPSRIPSSLAGDFERVLRGAAIFSRLALPRLADLDQLIPEEGRALYPRMILKGTSRYRRDPDLRDYIPHFTFLTSTDNFRGMVRRRMEMCDTAIQQEIPQ